MTKPDFEVGIIGAGFGGLAMALRLQKEGRESFVIFERANEVGGTWRDNTYPGCACDVPSHLYSLAAEPNPDWSRAYSQQPEILNYLKNCVDRNNLKPKIRFNSEVVSAVFDKQNGFWKITDQHGESITARLVVSATGPLNRPNIPKIEGIENFKGLAFHSSAWPENLDLRNKNVAVIGTGASVIQIVPSIAPIIKNLTVFQRTAAWVTPRNDRAISGFEKALFKIFPPARKLYREAIYWFSELVGLSFLGNKTIRSIATKQAITHLESTIKDIELRKKLTPNYEIGCKRVLVSDDYYPAFNRPNVALETQGIKEITNTGIITENGEETPFDVIVFGTGFIASEILIDTKIIGLNDRDLIEEWKKFVPEAYLGISVSGFPNMKFLLGPNTGLGHNSVVHIMESQVNYIMDYLEKIEKISPTAYFDVLPESQVSYNQDLQEKLKTTVWASGCSSWYQTSKGHNSSILPELSVTYRKKTKQVNLQDFQLLNPQ